jgi:hypothetical protein
MRLELETMPKKLSIPNGFCIAVTKYMAMECSTTDLAKEFQCAKATILKWMDALNIQRHRPSVMLSVKLKGKQSRLGKKHSEATLAKMREANRPMPSTLGFKFSDESKLKMRNSAIARAVREGKKIRVKNPCAPVKKAKEIKPVKIKVVKIKLSDEEKIAREKARQTCKRMVNRVLFMSRTKKDGRRAEHILGYSKHDLRSHLESQFRDGMSWLKRESFHVDHIKPIAQFFREGIFDPAVINALENLRALTPQENRKKSDSFSDKPKRQALIIDQDGVRGYV